MGTRKQVCARLKVSWKHIPMLDCCKWEGRLCEVIQSGCFKDLLSNTFYKNLTWFQHSLTWDQQVMQYWRFKRIIACNNVSGASIVRLLLWEYVSLPSLSRNRSEREVRGAGLVLQTVWGYKELRRTLEKDGWKKTDFMVNLNPPSNNTRANGGYEDSTLPLIDKGQEPEWKQVSDVYSVKGLFVEKNLRGLLTLFL